MAAPGARLPQRVLRLPNRSASGLAHDLRVQPGPRPARRRVFRAHEPHDADADPRDLVHGAVQHPPRAARVREPDRRERDLRDDGDGVRPVVHRANHPVRPFAFLPGERVELTLGFAGGVCTRTTPKSTSNRGRSTWATGSWDGL